MKDIAKQMRGFASAAEWISWSLERLIDDGLIHETKIPLEYPLTAKATGGRLEVVVWDSVSPFSVIISSWSFLLLVYYGWTLLQW